MHVCTYPVLFFASPVQQRVQWHTKIKLTRRLYPPCNSEVLRPERSRPDTQSSGKVRSFGGFLCGINWSSRVIKTLCELIQKTDLEAQNSDSML